MNRITFEQMPEAVSLLIEKIESIEGKLDNVLCKTRTGEERQLLDAAAVSTLLGKSVSTIYAMTCEKRIPYHKRGNKLYFFNDEIMKWIEQGGTSGTACDEDFAERLETLRSKKKRKPASLHDVNTIG